MEPSGRIWIPAFLLLLSCSAVASELLRARRLRRFGDPALLGAERTILQVAAAILLFVASAGALGAILWGGRVNSQPEGKLEMAVVIDAGAVDALAAERGSVTEVVRKVAEPFPDLSLAIFRSESALQQVSPMTADLEGALMLVDRLPADESETSGTLREHVATVLASEARADAEPILAVVTKRPPADVEAIFPATQGLAPLVVYMADGAAPEFGTRTSAGLWTWSADPAAASRAIVAQRSGRTGLRAWIERFGRARILAAIVFVLLAAQTMLDLRRRHPRVSVR